MAFCNPSGEICSNSATTLISCALTTDATSWPSACFAAGRTKSCDFFFSRLQLVSMLLFLSWIILEARVLPIFEVNRRSYLVFLKVDIAQVQHRGKNSKNWELVFRSKVKDLHGSTQTQIVICITLSFYSTVSSLSRREKRRTSKYKTNTYGGRVVSKLLVVNIFLLPGWGNSRSQPPVGRTLASAVRADLPASRRRCDSSSHLWPETEIHTQYLSLQFTAEQSKEHKVSCWLSVSAPGRQYGTFPTDTERLWHHWLHHWRKRQRDRDYGGEITSWCYHLNMSLNQFILTPPERPLCISQSDWNYRSAQFWHFQKIPAEELLQVSNKNSTTLG